MKTERGKEQEVALPTRQATFAKHAQKFNDPETDPTQHVSMANTHKDWFRSFDGDTPSEYYFDGKRACAGWTSADCTEESIATVFATHLSHIDPKLREYFQLMAHQNGYMNVSQTALLHDVMTKADFAYKPIFDVRQYHYISNADGSVTFLESYPVYGYEAPEFHGPGLIKPKNNEPLAVVVCESIVRLENGLVKHDLVSEDVYGLHASLTRTIKVKKKPDVLEQIDTKTTLVSDESTYHPRHGKSYAALRKEIDLTHPNHRLRNVLIGVGIGLGVALIATGVVAAVVFSGGIAAAPLAAGAIGAVVGLKGTLATVLGFGAMVAGISTFFATIGGALGGAISDLKQARGVVHHAPKPKMSGRGGAVKEEGRGSFKKKAGSTLANLRRKMSANDLTMISDSHVVTPEVVVYASSQQTERALSNEDQDHSLEDPSRHPSSPGSR